MDKIPWNPRKFEPHKITNHTLSLLSTQTDITNTHYIPLCTHIVPCSESLQWYGGGHWEYTAPNPSHNKLPQQMNEMPQRHGDAPSSGCGSIEDETYSPLIG